MKIQINARNRAHHFDAGAGEKILCAGLARGIGLPYECGSGTCGTCRARLVSGQIEEGWAEAPGRKYLKSADEFLMCQCTAVGDLALEVTGFVEDLDPAVCVPAAFKGRIRETRMLTRDVIELSIDLDSAMDFDAGQFVLVSVASIPGARGWSMVNHERHARTLRFIVKRKPGGQLSDWLFETPREGCDVDVFGPLGAATFYPELAKNIVCIAGGSGVAGMMAILERAVAANYFDRHEGDLFFGVRTMADAFYLEELAAYRARAGERLRITIVLSEQAASAAEQAAHSLLRFDTGFVHEAAGRLMQGRLQGVRAYLAGPAPAVDASVRLLLMARVPGSDIRYDKFS
ncbi:MAG: 2Fe-2S iron-sulfur cluster binding domain-containing protein [Burkholderiales bacterium]|nr:2Fe-2S iron-sulfur cluster binding domain-containing protein [Burkholderiales bacterium]